MSKKILSLILLFCLCSGLSGCATGRETGGLIGSVLGAGAGALAFRTHPLIGAALGTAVGAAAGSVTGAYADEQRRFRQDVLREVRYKQNNQRILQIRESIANPNIIRPGETVSLTTAYYLLSPSPYERIRISEWREIVFGGEKVTRPFSRAVMKEQGFTESTLSLPIPINAQEGEYTVITTIENGHMRDQKISTFYVRNT